MIKNRIDKGLESYIKNPTNFPNKFLIHHSGGVDSNPLADTSHHTFETVYHWHKFGRGWTTIGYHFFIAKDGTVTQGRPVGMHGAHEKTQNKQSIGICLAGNFDATMPSEAQNASLSYLLKKLSTIYDIHVAEPHRKYANKTCYGKNLPDDWAQNLLSEVSDQRQICFKANDWLGMLKTAIKVYKDNKK